MRRLNTCAAALLLLLTALPSHAAPYFDTARFDPQTLPPPPAPQSAEWKRDIDALVALQAKADPVEVQKAADEMHMSRDMITLPVDPSLTRKKHPVLYALLSRVSDTCKPATDAAKEYWNTKRPYLSDPRVKALIGAHSNPSYPSGHTSGSYCWAYALGLVIPEKKEPFLARAEEIAQHRVLVGMHYPHDIEGGKILAARMFEEMQRSPDFQRDVKRAREEYNKKQPQERTQ